MLLFITMDWLFVFFYQVIMFYYQRVISYYLIWEYFLLLGTDFLLFGTDQKELNSNVLNCFLLLHYSIILGREEINKLFVKGEGGRGRYTFLASIHRGAGILKRKSIYPPRLPAPPLPLDPPPPPHSPLFNFRSLLISEH